MKLIVALWLCALAACSEAHKNIVSDPPRLNDRDSGSRADAGDRDARAAIDASSHDIPIDASAATAYCGKRACSCSDGSDNDGDGLDDGLDPECTGAYDDDEASFATGQPNKQSTCRDCYWDANSGSGDDGCRYPEECLTDAQFVGKGSCRSCAVSDACVSRCRDRTPNGCDCFGCCAVALPNGELVTMQLSDNCALTKLNDLTACPRCTMHDTCKNDCGRCELCLGKTLADLPADCRTGTGPGYVCENELKLCSPDSPCLPGYYCHQGCCLVDLL